ncbi:MAG: MFS transporter [Betaproteobacteria bacterium]|nr:MFS transporter [Betaproteobacteria bacterium]
MTIGNGGMYAATVALPLVQADFGIGRSDASLPYTLTMIGFGLGGIMMGRLADRFGVMMPVIGGAIFICGGFVAASFAPNIWTFALLHGVLIGFFGCAATFAPLIADVSQWFTKRRGIAVAIVISGNYVAGAIWPLVLENTFSSVGWRATYIGVGIFSLATMIPLALLLGRPPPSHENGDSAPHVRFVADRPLGFSPAVLQAILVLASIACCVAMSMPIVHIVAYCGDLGIAAARGAEMLSLMLASGIVSRLASGWISDQIGALRTLLLGSTLQGAALLLFLPFDGLASLYVVSAMFGLFQGGIVPMYAIIVRDYFPPSEAGTRVGVVMMATMLGMALGGWMSGAVFDLTGSYRAAFLNGSAWNLFNVAIAAWLLYRHTRLYPTADRSRQ